MTNDKFIRSSQGPVDSSVEAEAGSSKKKLRVQNLDGKLKRKRVEEPAPEVDAEPLKKRLRVRDANGKVIRNSFVESSLGLESERQAKKFSDVNDKSDKKESGAGPAIPGRAAAEKRKKSIRIREPNGQFKVNVDSVPERAAAPVRTWQPTKPTQHVLIISSSKELKLTGPDDDGGRPVFGSRSSINSSINLKEYLRSQGLLTS